MATTTHVEVTGAKQAIIALRKIEPQLRKEFNAEINRVGAPAVRAGQNAYTQVPLSQMKYRWNYKGRNVFPFTVQAAKSGVKVVADTKRKATASILIQQMNPAAAIFETAGRKNMNRLGQSLDYVAGQRGFKEAQAGRTRLLGRAVYKAKKSIEKEMGEVVLKVINDVERKLR